MTHDRIGDVYYDASRSDETVSLKGLCAVADAADRAAVRRVLDEIGVLVDNDDRHALVDYIVKTREGLE